MGIANAGLTDFDDLPGNKLVGNKLGERVIAILRSERLEWRHRAGQALPTKRPRTRPGLQFLGVQKKSVVRDQRRGAPIEVVVEAPLDHPNVGVVVTQQD